MRSLLGFGVLGPLAGSVVVAACRAGSADTGYAVAAAEDAAPTVADADPTAADAASTEAPATCDGFVSAYCGVFAACCSKVGLPVRDGDCEKTYQGVMSGQPYDPEQAAACLAGLRAESASADFCDEGAMSAACFNVLQAPINAVGYCRMTDYVGSGTEITDKVGATPCVGNVIDGRVSGTGGSGGSPNYICDTRAGVFCDNPGGVRCHQVHQIGQPCSDYASCVTTARCADGTCIPRGAVGDDCNVNLSRQCQNRLICDRTTGKCAAGLEVGVPCMGPDLCLAQRCTNGRCGPGVLPRQLFCKGATDAK